MRLSEPGFFICGTAAAFAFFCKNATESEGFDTSTKFDWLFVLLLLVILLAAAALLTPVPLKPVVQDDVIGTVVVAAFVVLPTPTPSANSAKLDELSEDFDDDDD